MVGLWKPDGKQLSIIWIHKEIWININGAGDGLGDGTRYPVFHVYNGLDYSKADSRDSGGRINPLKQPFLDFDKALKVAQIQALDALFSGDWVPTEEMPQY
ncbi:hypothetical protein ACFL2U_03785 [Patescibacteria group bacterium]